MDFVVAAAGQSGRFKDKKSKLLQPLWGKTVIEVVHNNIRDSEIADRITFIVKYQAGDIQAVLPGSHFVTQGDYGGLRGPAMALRSFLESDMNHHDEVMMMFGDLPGLTDQDINTFYYQAKGEPSILVARTERPEFMWVHHKQGIPYEVNREFSGIGDVGLYYFPLDWLKLELPNLAPKSYGEYYINGLVEQVYPYNPFHMYYLKNSNHAIGVNTKEDLEFVRSQLKE